MVPKPQVSKQLFHHIADILMTQRSRAGTGQRRSRRVFESSVEQLRKVNLQPHTPNALARKTTICCWELFKMLEENPSDYKVTLQLGWYYENFHNWDRPVVNDEQLTADAIKHLQLRSNVRLQSRFNQSLSIDCKKKLRIHLQINAQILLLFNDD